MYLSQEVHAMIDERFDKNCIFNGISSELDARAFLQIPEVNRSGSAAENWHASEDPQFHCDASKQQVRIAETEKDFHIKMTYCFQVE